ncbi:MAG: hypothetical protein OXQ31_10875 [Spirochaetaceae bacterium]|nr:hypothetical protein [Spirochaetaceae bacterium]
MVLLGCDITQEHIDQASERLAEATVATGSPPSAGSVTLRAEHIAGSTWRMIHMEASRWPHADAVVTIGSNGRLIWHAVSGALENFGKASHWSVDGSGALQLWYERGGRQSAWTNPSRGTYVDQNHACLGWVGSCELVLQRVTP